MLRGPERHPPGRAGERTARLLDRATLGIDRVLSATRPPVGSSAGDVALQVQLQALVRGVEAAGPVEGERVRPLHVGRELDEVATTSAWPGDDPVDTPGHVPESRAERAHGIR
jgi:hypothetical protein